MMRFFKMSRCLHWESTSVFLRDRDGESCRDPLSVVGGNSRRSSSPRRLPGVKAARTRERVGDLPRLSRPEFGTGLIAHRTIGQIGDRNGIPVRDELLAGTLAGVEEVAAPPHLARQTGPCGSQVGIHDPTCIVPVLRHRTVPSVLLVQAPTFGGLARRWQGNSGGPRGHG
jgi:hypothetical protein